MMNWLFVAVSLAVLWVASLCKILFGSLSSPYKDSFLNDGRTRNVLLVIAHPDDESMFFTPTINYLTSRGHNVLILCMSTGNADGMGSIRREELYLASTILKVILVRFPAVHAYPQPRTSLFVQNFTKHLIRELPHDSSKMLMQILPHHVKVLDHPDLQDGFGFAWNSDLLAKIISQEINTQSIDLVITFDSYGVSGHCNHRDVYQGVRKFLHEDSQRKVEAWELVSTNILRKYSGAFDIWLSILFAKYQHHPDSQLKCFLNENPRKTYAAMAQHKSQWVWFRKLFVSLTSYTYVNTLKKIK